VEHHVAHEGIVGILFKQKPFGVVLVVFVIAVYDVDQFDYAGRI